MYKNLSFYGKTFSFILLVIAMILIKNYNIFLLICGMIFILSFINKEKVYFAVGLALFLITYIIPFNEYLFIGLRISLVILYALIIESSLLSLEKRYLYDILFYRNQTASKLKGYVKQYYYDDCVSKNIEDNKRIEKYIEDKDKYKNYLKKQAGKKADCDIDELYLVDRVRFDRYYSSKKGNLGFSWNNYDNFYITVSLIFFILVIVVGR